MKTRGWSDFGLGRARASCFLPKGRLCQGWMPTVKVSLGRLQRKQEHSGVQEYNQAE